MKLRNLSEETLVRYRDKYWAEIVETVNVLNSLNDKVKAIDTELACRAERKSLGYHVRGG